MTVEDSALKLGLISTGLESHCEHQYYDACEVPKKMRIASYTSYLASIHNIITAIKRLVEILHTLINDIILNKFFIHF